MIPTPTVICDREAVGYLIFDWRNGDSQDTTSSAFYVARKAQLRRRMEMISHSNSLDPKICRFGLELCGRVANRWLLA